MDSNGNFIVGFQFQILKRETENLIAMKRITAITVLTLLFVAAANANGQAFVKEETYSAVIRNAELPEELAKKIDSALTGDSDFITDMLTCLSGEKYLRQLVDKQHPLDKDFAPKDYVVLDDDNYQLIRSEPLRRVAARSLREMAAAARADKVTLVISSAYRSYDYQTIVYNRNVRELGKKIADRESAQPGYSQHQTGLAVDFHPVKDSFEKTDASRWLEKNASRFGWSISYPKGYETVTGYKWESWHYRYVGVDLTHFIDTYFEGIQQYALRFLHEWELIYGTQQ